jgi:3',5'-cyclic AMP phosphodiesterase CpdA
MMAGMSSPFLLVQLSDFHIGADWDVEGEPAGGLKAAVEAVRAVVPRPDALLVSGDLADGGADAEYERVRELLAPLGTPPHVLPGNHDDRAALRRQFGLPGTGAEPVCYAADLGPLRLLVLDSTIPGEDGGALDGGRLEWLERELAAAPGRPALIALHHPPLLTGIPAWDAIGLAEADRRALGEVVGRHPQVRRIVGGHVHRTIAGQIGGCAELSVPSTYVQGRLDFSARELQLADEPAGFAVHALLHGEVTSHIQPINR